MLAAPARGRRLWLVYPACLLAAALGVVADLVAILQATDIGAILPFGLPGTGLRLRLDPLAAFFGLIVNIGVAAASVYGLGLDRDHELSPRVEPLFPAFAAAMNLVLIADDVYSFLFFWELMSLSSWALVVARHDDPANRHAGHVYLVMAAIGTMALLLAFAGLAGGADDFGFASLRAAPRAPYVAGLVLVAALVGAGSKAGLAPLHAWLPLAHPAAPSHVSALMSGVMTKVAIYAILRIIFDLLGAPEWWWSLPLLALGAATAALGLLYALFDNDLKRVLAYSTVENIGVIFVALGLALAFRATGLEGSAAVALAAGLLHALNHSWFKSLLFLGAGAVLHATGKRDFDGLGGLIHNMPKTAAFWLVGAMSIAALPPFNGFVSEWLLFQAVLTGPSFPVPVLRFLSPVVGALLALAAALAAACFVRAFGVAFLGRPRDPAAANAHEAPRAQLIAMGALATLCLVGGLFGGVIVQIIRPILMAFAGAALPGMDEGPTPFSLVAFSAARSTYDAPTVAAFLLASGCLATWCAHRLSNRRTRRAPAWDCGFPEPSPRTQYTASSFSQPLRRVYGGLLFGAVEKVDMPAPGETRPARLTVTLRDYLWECFYRAPALGVARASRWLDRLQSLPIRDYLLMMCGALIILLLVAAGLS